MKNHYKYLFIFLLAFCSFSATSLVVIKNCKKVTPIPSIYIAETDSGNLSSSAGNDRSSNLRLKDTRNYFHIDEDKTSLWNGKYWPLDNFPLLVYVEKSYSHHYKKRYKNYIDYAFKLWNKADPRISFSYVDFPDEADIIIVFEENLTEIYNQNYLGLTDYELNDDQSIRLSFIQIGLLNSDDEPISAGEMKATIIHEMGHALGLGHSDNSADIMYPFIDAKSNIKMDFNELSFGDELTIKSILNLGDRKAALRK